MRRPLRNSTIVVLLALPNLLAQSLAAPQGRGRGRDQRPDSPPQGTFHTTVPEHAVDVIQGRPTADGITLSVLFHQSSPAVLRYGAAPGAPTEATPTIDFVGGLPRELPLVGLRADTEYAWQLVTPQGSVAQQGAFHTQRPPGSAFRFTMTADSHLDENCVPALYARCLANAVNDRPDFHIDLGDTFMTDKHPSRDSALRQYLAQRWYFGQLSSAASLFLVLGNHDGENHASRDDDAGGLPIWSNAMRRRYYLEPRPDKFYTGNHIRAPDGSPLQNYYAWEWGDGLFVVLDPFWFSQRVRGGGDCWHFTLGREQYDWLRHTLEHSQANVKLIFIHHLVGGFGKDGRGGAEAAKYGEWGGCNADGTDGFSANRPGWPEPIHQLLKRTHVAAVFHGHDHLYARQELGGILYHELPQPGHRRGGAEHAAEYGYQAGRILPGSGHLRVTVSRVGAKVEFVQAVLPEDERGTWRNGAVPDTYVQAAR